MNYYYSKKGDLHGPVTWKELQRLYDKHQLVDETPVCAEGDDVWRTFGEIEGDNSSISNPEVSSIAQPPPVPTIVPPPLQFEREYTVVPFVAVVAKNANSSAAATQLQTLIQSYAAQGWEYVRLESVETVHAGGNGCFGFGATPARITVYSMVVFKR